MEAAGLAGNSSDVANVNETTGVKRETMNVVLVGGTYYGERRGLNVGGTYYGERCGLNVGLSSDTTEMKDSENVIEETGVFGFKKDSWKECGAGPEPHDTQGVRGVGYNTSTGAGGREVCDVGYNTSTGAGGRGAGVSGTYRASPSHASSPPHVSYYTQASSSPERAPSLMHTTSPARVSTPAHASSTRASTPAHALSLTHTTSPACASTPAHASYRAHAFSSPPVEGFIYDANTSGILRGEIFEGILGPPRGVLFLDLSDTERKKRLLYR